MISGLGTRSSLIVQDNQIVSETVPLPRLPPSSTQMVHFDVICITAHLATTAKALAKELQYYSGVSCDKIIAVSDLAGARMGSGGATLDALVMVVEHLSSLNGDPHHNEQRLKGKRILILHTGGNTYNPASWLPSTQCASDGRPQTAIELLFQTLHAIGTPPKDEDCELWVCSSEMLVTSGLDLVPVESALDWSQRGMTIFSQAIPAHQAASHGVLKLGPSIRNCIHPVEQFKYRTDGSTLKNDGFVLVGIDHVDRVAMACGLIRMDYSAASVYFGLHVVAPFSSCTSFGVDDGMTVTPFSLFLHVIPALLGDEDYNCRNYNDTHFKLLTTHLSGRFPLHTVLASSSLSDNNSAVTYVHSIPDAIQYTRCSVFNSKANSSGNGKGNNGNDGNDGGSIVLNSVLQGNGHVSPLSVVVNCAIDGDDWGIGSNSVVVGLHDKHGQLSVPDNCVVQEVFITAEHKRTTTVVSYGIQDDWNLESNDENATFCGEKWVDFLNKTKLLPDQIWTLSPASPSRTLASAKLFCATSLDTSKKNTFWWWSADPTVIQQGRQEFLKTSIDQRYSLLDLAKHADLTQEFQRMHDLQFQMDSVFIRHVLLNRQHIALLDVYERCAARNEQRIYPLLDEIAMSTSDMDVVARTLAHVADVLAAFAGKGRGLRSGPARNPAWQNALELLTKEESRKEGIHQMAKIRDEWRKKGPDMMIRASRHYEGGGQRLILAATSTCHQFIPQTECPWEEGMGAWAVATAPARLDLSGGWSDTPPLCFEHGGAVTNIGIRIDGQRPIGAKARLIAEPHLVFVVNDRRITCTTIADLHDYGTPQAPAALLKCALLSIGIVNLTDSNDAATSSSSVSSSSLQKQLAVHTKGCGIEIKSWSNLPTGSGLGTSSILAACIIAAAARVCGKHLSEDSLVHAVLLTEQLLTTGGGWQDNVGGVYGGAKICRSAPGLPLKVTTEAIPISSTFQKTLNERLVIIYTGRARLARNLLQNVVRRWYSRLPEIVETVKRLTKTAVEAANAIEKEDLVQLGECLSKYWTQKKCMAEGCEPEFVKQMRQSFDEYIYGCSLAGAGGGGFMGVITKEPNAIDVLQEQLDSLSLNIPGQTIHACTVDMEGLTVVIEKIFK